MAKKGRAKRQTIRGMTVDAADLDPDRWAADRPGKASEDDIGEKQPADKPSQPKR